MEEIEPTPLTWLREAWAHDPLEILLPAAAGALLAQGLTAALVVRSHHNILLAVCLMALGISISRSAAFFLKLARGRHTGEKLVVSAQELQLLFLPLILAIVIYGMIAPNLWLGTIFALMSLPHLLLLAHVGKHYTAITPLPAHAYTQTLVARFEIFYMQVRSLATGAAVALKSLRAKRANS